MALTPRFEEDVHNTGLDKHVRPPWLTVPHEFATVVKLVNGDGMVVKARPPGVITLTEDPAGTAHQRLFTIRGDAPGPARVGVFAPGRSVAETWLEVRVKELKMVDIAFHYVEDDLSNQTTRNRSPSFLDELERVLSSTYFLQTSIMFTRTRAVPIQVNTSLRKILSEQLDAGDLREKGELYKLGLQGDAEADINVFFMRWSGPVAQRPSQMMGTNWTCICEDSMTDAQVKIALPHMVGRFLGCQPDFNEKHKHHLMFASRAEGIDPLGRSIDLSSFIPRDCSNMMNPGWSPPMGDSTMAQPADSASIPLLRR